MGKILAICTSPKRGTVKTEVPSAVLTPEWGIVSDAHGGNWHRQVSLLSAEKIEAFRKKIWVDYGAFGENLVIEGFDFRSLPVTSRFAIGSGGIFGNGFFDGRYYSVPNAHNDFIFSWIGNAAGFVGCCVVLGCLLYTSRCV